jgi:hypothetical protein
MIEPTIRKGTLQIITRYEIQLHFLPVSYRSQRNANLECPFPFWRTLCLVIAGNYQIGWEFLLRHPFRLTATRIIIENYSTEY